MANQDQDRHPKAYYNAAKGYQAAADRLLQVIEAREGLAVRDPTCFLYAHAVELALKACLLARNLYVARSGPKGTPYKGATTTDCRRHKLLGMNDPDHEMNNLIYFLGTGNERNQYRYPDKPKVPRAMPALPWTREVVGRLIAEVEPHVESLGRGSPGRQRRQQTNSLPVSQPTRCNPARLSLGLELGSAWTQPRDGALTSAQSGHVPVDTDGAANSEPTARAPDLHHAGWRVPDHSSC